VLGWRNEYEEARRGEEIEKDGVSYIRGAGFVSTMRQIFGASNENG
jgi:hypothetical protein